MGNMAETVALGADTYTDLLQSAPERSIAGGAIYDAVILESGLAANADVLLTFNERQFRILAGAAIQIVIPA
jgi:predicted nucleic acid-binding protein